MIKLLHEDEIEPYGGRKAFAEKYSLPFEKVKRMSLDEMDDYVINLTEEQRLNNFLDDIEGVMFLPDGF